MPEPIVYEQVYELFAILTSSLFIVALLIVFAGDAICDELNADDYVARYRAHDLARNNGMGNSTHTSSSTLAWGESYILNDYIMLYRVTRDAYWLEQVIQHFDQMIYGMTQTAPQTDPRKFSAAEVDAMVSKMIQEAKSCDLNQVDEAGHPVWNTEYPGWYTDRYSVAHVEVIGTDSKTAELVPGEERISNINRAHEITGHQYRITFHDSSRYTVVDLGPVVGLAGADPGERAETVIARSVELSESITEIPGASFKIKGVPGADDKFEIRTIEPKALQYTVHDGMVLYPIAQFMEIVLNDAKLREQFGEKMESYIKLIKEVFVRKWEKYWVELDDDAGAYRFTESPAERAPNRLLPHNQYNALCRAYLVLQDEKVLDDPVLREKARKMVRYFKGNLRSTGDAWTWNYWDWGTGEGEHSGVEDSSHASINIGTAVEAYHRGIEFEQKDMVRFAHTLLDQMWNGSPEDPNIGDRVDTDEGATYSPVRHWIELCEFDPKVLDIYIALFKYKGEPINFIPAILHASYTIQPGGGG